MRLQSLGEMSPIDGGYDVEATILRVFAAAHTGILVRVAVELVVHCRCHLVGHEVKLDRQLSLALVHDFGEAFQDVPVGFLVLCVAEQATIWIKHLCVLINGFLASVLLFYVFHLYTLMLHLGQMCLKVPILFVLEAAHQGFPLVFFNQIGLYFVKDAEPLGYLLVRQLEECRVALNQGLASARPR